MVAIPYNDGLVEAKESNHPGWVAIDWVYPGQAPLRTRRVFAKVEKAIKEAGFCGWLMWSDREHVNMHRHIQRYGGVLYAQDANKLYFKKEMVS